jgi:subtilisin family serine protease
MKKAILIFSFFLISVALIPQTLDQSFIAVNSTSVKEFLDNHPEYDGRGTVILILDSGVDIGIDGLTTTSTGERKVIDVQDFSGEGDFFFSKAEVDDDMDTLFFYNEENQLEVKVTESNLLQNDRDYFIGAVEEGHWLNSSSKVTDINNNTATDDKFVFITFKEKNSDDWVVYLDTNGDGTLNDEKPLKNFKINKDQFTIRTEEGEPNFAFGLNIFPEENKIVIHYDAVSHGTHCAGIAAGNKIGNDEFYGIAPGAYLGSLKIGSSIYSGGAMRINLAVNWRCLLL